MYFTGNQGTFRRDRERALYAGYVGVLPEDYQLATLLEIEAYHKQHNARWSLVENNIGLAFVAFRKLVLKHEQDNYLWDVAIPTMYRCAELYNPVEAKLSTYLVSSIRFAVLTERRKRHEFGQLRDDICVEDAPSDNSLQYVMDALDPRERLILHFHFWKGWTNAQIGELLGVGRERVRQLMDRALSKCRRVLNGNHSDDFSGDLFSVSQHGDVA